MAGQDRVEDRSEIRRGGTRRISEPGPVFGWFSPDPAACSENGDWLERSEERVSTCLYPLSRHIGWESAFRVPRRTSGHALLRAKLQAPAKEGQLGLTVAVVSLLSQPSMTAVRSGVGVAGS